MTESTLHSNKYLSRPPSLIEFIFRGAVREEKEKNVRAAERSAFNSRELLNKLIHEFSEKYSKPLDTPTLKKGRSFYEWIQGKDRAVMLETKQGVARRMEAEALEMESRLTTICKLHNEYLRDASIFFKTAEDAVYHDDSFKGGWTWWR